MRRQNGGEGKEIEGERRQLAQTGRGRETIETVFVHGKKSFFCTGACQDSHPVCVVRGLVLGMYLHQQHSNTRHSGHLRDVILDPVCGLVVRQSVGGGLGRCWRTNGQKARCATASSWPHRLTREIEVLSACSFSPRLCSPRPKSF